MPKLKKKTVNMLTWKSEKGGVVPLIIILMSIIAVFIASRLLTYLVVVANILPSSLFLNIGDFRLHHFVYGNIIIVLTSFLAIGLGIAKHHNLFALFYGIGLGLILDEFLLWMGDTEALTQITLWIPHSLTVVAIVSILITTLIMIDLYKIKMINRRVTLKRRG